MSVRLLPLPLHHRAGHRNDLQSKKIKYTAIVLTQIFP